MNSVSATDEFLKNTGMHPDCVDAPKVREAFLAEMREGLAGLPSSLHMIPTYLSADGRPADGETAVAVDIGGTNLRVALTRMRSGCLEILESAVSPVPGLKSEITRDTFFREIAEKLLPVADKSRRVGVCFSHPAEILPDRDGRLIAFSKEIKVKDAAGMLICRGIGEQLRALGVREEKRFALLNDTAAVVLGGLKQSERADIGLVLGTGMNIGYVEEVSRIGKLASGFGGGTMIVNTEAGCFDKLSPGEFDRALDARTENPGDHILEKMTSGAYLGSLICAALRYAGGTGLLSDGCAEAVNTMNAVLLPDASTFLADKSGPLATLCATEDDKKVFYTVVDRLVERSAKLVAAAVGAVTDRAGAAADAGRPVTIMAEGSTIRKMHGFEEKFTGYLFKSRQSQRDFSIGYTENATLCGAGYAALLNCP